MNRLGTEAALQRVDRTTRTAAPRGYRRRVPRLRLLDAVSTRRGMPVNVNRLRFQSAGDWLGR
jgi:hypothetical protein